MEANNKTSCCAYPKDTEHNWYTCTLPKDHNEMHKATSCWESDAAVLKGEVLYSWVSELKMESNSMYTYRTQKAKGLNALRNFYGSKMPAFSVYPIEKFIDETGVVDTQRCEAHLVGRFVRPCPITPRHGFVDSREILNLEEALKIVLETFNADPKAELVTMKKINAPFSGIYTPGAVIIGTGHDGATSGTSSKLIPTLGLPDSDKRLWKTALKYADISDQPYLELLFCKSMNEYDAHFVQLRNGPKISAQSVDYIPEKIKVKEIVEAKGDLLEWETKVKAFASGTVVYHPKGNLASHYSVHCAINNVPVLISRKPEIGETLIPTEETKKSNIDILKLRAGFVYGATKKLSYELAAYIMLSACHNIAIWKGKQDFLLGVGMGCAYRLIVAASLGEYRHRPSRKTKTKLSRNTVYKRCWDKILTPTNIKNLSLAITSFNSEQWGGAFGGKAWFNVASFAVLLYNDLVNNNVNKALEDYNKAVNAVHNGGWAFDKFVPRLTMDRAAENPAIVVISCAPELFEALTAYERNQKFHVWFNGRSINRSLCKDVLHTNCGDHCPICFPGGNIILAQLSINEGTGVYGSAVVQYVQEFPGEKHGFREKKIEIYNSITNIMGFMKDHPEKIVASFKDGDNRRFLRLKKESGYGSYYDLKDLPLGLHIPLYPINKLKKVKK